MADLLALSARLIDEGASDPATRITLELSELSEDIALFESFSNVVVLDSGDGLVLFDASLGQLGALAIQAVRAWSSAPVHTLVYTHGHVDHVGGARSIIADAAERGDPRPEVVAHEAVPDRFERYRLTNGYNAHINHRQFRASGLVPDGDGGPRFPSNFVPPDVTYRDRLDLSIGDLHIELRHGLGETDDHTWGWMPDRRTVCVGDFVIWAFPNAGNPQKVQRFPLEWAQVLREMHALEPELLLPAHGLPIAGVERIATVLDDTATALEGLVRDTLERMNAGATLDSILHEVRVPAALLERPYLRPVYDDPEFVVRNVWRLYGGWYDGNPARLKPPGDAALAKELAALAGGALPLATRARELAESGDLRMAGQLVEFASLAEPDDPAVHEIRAEVYRLRRHAETSRMGKGIFGDAEAQSRARLQGPDQQ